MSQDLPKPGKDDVISKAVSSIKNYALTAGEERIGNVLAGLLEERAEEGIKTYGTRLQTFNGRDAKRDLLEECLDAVNYATQLNMEDPNKYTTRLKGLMIEACIQVQEYIQLKSAPVTGTQVG